MKINNVDHRKQILLEEIEKLRIELSVLYKERDRVYNQIADQRHWASIVVHEKRRYENEIEWLMMLFNSTKELLNKTTTDFHNISESQAQTIREISWQINAKLSELEEYNQKELIDIDSLNLKYKTSLQALLKDIWEAELRLSQLEKTMDEKNKKHMKESEKLEKQKEYQEKVKQSLAKREQKLKLKEKRLNKLHLELKKKKNG